MSNLPSLTVSNIPAQLIRRLNSCLIVEEATSNPNYKPGYVQIVHEPTGYVLLFATDLNQAQKAYDELFASHNLGRMDMQQIREFGFKVRQRLTEQGRL